MKYLNILGENLENSEENTPKDIVRKCMYVWEESRCGGAKNGFATIHSQKSLKIFREKTNSHVEESYFGTIMRKEKPCRKLEFQIANCHFSLSFKTASNIHENIKYGCCLSVLFTLNLKGHNLLLG